MPPGPAVEAAFNAWYDAAATGCAWCAATTCAHSLIRRRRWRMGELPGLPETAFETADASPDVEFYAYPRFVTHILDKAIAAVTRVLPPGGAAIGCRGADHQRGGNSCDWPRSQAGGRAPPCSSATSVDVPPMSKVIKSAMVIERSIGRIKPAPPDRAVGQTRCSIHCRRFWRPD